eukprot:SAG11_NODE_48053_length_125_cov_431.423077_1_plen_26_part_10
MGLNYHLWCGLTVFRTYMRTVTPQMN